MALVELLRGTVSGRPDEVKRCEAALEVERKQHAEFPLRLLEIVASESVAQDARLAGAIFLKNTLRKDWSSNHAGQPTGERIKEAIVPVLLHVPRTLQTQLSATISIIAEEEFPLRWESLLPALVPAMKDEQKLVGALECVHAVLEKYRTIARSEDVLRQLQVILRHFQEPHLEIFKSSVQQLVQSGGAASAGRVVELVCGIFQSMNAVDIPEYYQDNLQLWVQGFAALLGLQGRPGASASIKTQVCDNLTLYADKYQEPFEGFVREAVQAVWQLLQRPETSDEEQLVAAGLKFLASAANTQWEPQCNPFSDPQALRAIVEQAIIPNMQLQPGDLEIFEDNPREYIARDVEGADQDTRRRAALDLVRSISRFHEVEMTALLLSHAQTLIQPAQAGDWRRKETCLYVIASLAIKGQTRSGGVTKTNERVDFGSFFQTQLLSEISDPQVDKFPVLRASILKFMTLFRNFIDLRTHTEIVARHLNAKNEVLFTYAAHALSYAVDQKTSPELLRSLAVSLAQKLMQAAVPNEYAMKLFMVLAQFLDERTLAEATQILPTLLGKILADPVNPMYTHYLFEAVAVAISRDTAIDQILSILVDGILAKNLVDFLPYAFQLLALILKKKPELPPVFSNLFPIILADELWSQTACVPALVHLVAAYFGKPGNFFTPDTVQRLLGKLQILLRKSSTENSGFDLLAHIFHALPLPLYQATLMPLLTFLLTEIRDNRTERKVRGLAVGLGAFIIANGTAPLKAALEQIQSGLFSQVLRGLFLTPLPDLPNKTQRKVCVVAVARVASEVADAGEDLQNVLVASNALVTKLATGVSGVTADAGLVREEEPEITSESFEGQFVRLRHAGVSEDFAASVADEWALLKAALKPKIPSAQNLPALAQWVLA